MKIKLAVFDLDGTLVSSHKTIYNAVVKTLKELKINEEIPEKEFYNLIGLHIEDIFKEFGFIVPDFDQFISIYKLVYFDYADSSFVYPGAIETIDFLKQKRIKISLLTTKAQDQAELNLSYFKLSDKFDYIMGRRPEFENKPSPEPLLKICKDLEIDISDTIMIGDTELDIYCGKNAGTKTCAVTYGYRSKKELIKTNPDLLIDKLDDLINIIDYSNS
jgi:phosphoglycolate phosphatase-like HAD superfamily hydrolase